MASPANNSGASIPKEEVATAPQEQKEKPKALATTTTAESKTDDCKSDDSKANNATPTTAPRGVAEQTSSTQAVYEEKTGEAMLQRDIPNKIIVARGKKISFYYERARRILRLFDGMIVTGFGSTVCMACSLVEVLRRNEMASIVRIETKLETPIHYVNINEHFNDPRQQRYYENAPPQTAIEFHLSVGKYGKYLSGYHQRKMIELFEKFDAQLSGQVSDADVARMKLCEVFCCNDEERRLADEFMANRTSLILPEFIKYCSLVVHPLIKDNMFKRILYKHFAIGSTAATRKALLKGGNGDDSKVDK